MSAMKNLRVAFINQPFEYVAPPHVGGSVALWTERVMRAMPPGDRQFIVYLKRFQGQPGVERHDGIEYRRIYLRPDEWLTRPMKAIDRRLGFPRPQKAYFTSPLHYLTYILQISMDLRARQVDIVHIHNYSQFAPIVRWFNPQARIVLHMHAEWLSQLDEQMIRRRIQHVDRVITCSEHVSAKIRARFPEYRRRVVTVYNGADESVFPPGEPAAALPAGGANAPERLLFVGRISPEKGIHVLLEAFCTLLAQRPGVQLDLVGAWGEMPVEYLVLLSQEKHVKDLLRFYPQAGSANPGSYADALKRLLPPEAAAHVRFHGQVQHDHLAPFFRNADLLINPSLSEAFSMPIAEAMINSLPVVATRVGGIPEVVADGETGILVEPGNADALAGAILGLLADPARRRAMGRASLARCRELFSYAGIAAQLLQLYAGVL